MERRHKTILQLARALFFQAGMPTIFWGEEILYATYLMNRLPLVVLDWKTPYQLLYNREVKSNCIKCFGNLCFSTFVDKRSNKFTLIASKCVFLGISPGQKGYKMYDLGKREIIVSRNVVFHEDMYPFKSKALERDINEVGPSLPIVPVVEDGDSVEAPILSNTDSNASASSPLENGYNSGDT